MATLAMFRATFPEMSGVPDPMVAQFMGLAALELDRHVWGQYGLVGGNMTFADSGQLYLSAHKLACSPFGQNAKMIANPRATGYDRTTYGAEFKLMMQSVTSGFRVA